jgi:hypothetical protein
MAPEPRKQPNKIPTDNRPLVQQRFQNIPSSYRQSMHRRKVKGICKATLLEFLEEAPLG